ncbi:uncharacterized protein [Nicotiana tomentosiformis]|uniref:uncharacterized protein n=1 Tax=Nicotiana tomentosiformis TaxID=4098 RepID=UPI00388CB5D5
MSEYAVRFSDLARNALTLAATVRERVRRFIQGLNPSIRFSMARELEMDITYQQVVGIAMRLEGMDWLSPYHSILDCHDKTVMLAMPGLPWLEWRVTLDYVPSTVVSFINAQWMVEKGCDEYLAYVRDFNIDTPTIESASIVRDYLDILLADLPGIPFDRDIDFGIDLLPSTHNISIPPYRMVPRKLKKLKEQLQEFLNKGFIRPSMSSWGTLVLFVKKKDGYM